MEPSLSDDGDIDGEEEDWPAGFQPRPAGTKAVKALRAADLSAAWEVQATCAALNRMARVAWHRTEIDFWDGPDVRRTKEAAQWRRLEMRRRLKALAGAALKDVVDDDTVEVRRVHTVTAMATCDSARRAHAEAAPAEEVAAAIVRAAPAGMSAEDGDWLDSPSTAPSTAVALVSPVTAAAVTDGVGTEVAPTSPATPAKRSPAAAHDAGNVLVVDVTDVVDLVDLEDVEEMPCTPPVVRSQRTKCRRFIESRDCL